MLAYLFVRDSLNLNTYKMYLLYDTSWNFLNEFLGPIWFNWSLIVGKNKILKKKLRKACFLVTAKYLLTRS